MVPSAAAIERLCAELRRVARREAYRRLTEGLGEIRDRTYENQQHRASGLNLVVSAIILWNTRYLERAVDVLRKSEDVPDSLLAHLSPLGWEHVNLTGDYVWGVEQSLSENNDGLRPLRIQADAFQKAA